MTDNTANVPLFARFAITYASSWVEPVPGGRPKRPWLFFINGGLATGRLELTEEGLAFAPSRTSRMRGMGPGFLPWSAVIDLGVFPRQGLFEASTVILRLHQGGNKLLIHTFSMSALLSALNALRSRNSSFPSIIT